MALYMVCMYIYTHGYRRTYVCVYICQCTYTHTQRKSKTKREGEIEIERERQRGRQGGREGREGGKRRVYACFNPNFSSADKDCEPIVVRFGCL